MKCYVIDTLTGVYAIDDGGNFLNFIDFMSDVQKAVTFYNSLDEKMIVNDYKDFMNDLVTSGFDEFVFDNKKLKEITSQNLKYSSSLETSSLEFRNFRFSLEDQLKKVGDKNKK